CGQLTTPPHRCRFGTVTPVVVAALRDLKLTAHPGHRESALRVLAHEFDELIALGYGCSFAKYAAAFFRNATSISSSRIRRSARSRSEIGRASCRERA